MILPIELWLSATELAQDARRAFSDSVLCYKAGAYAPALLASYLGWGLALRARLLGARAPEGFSPEHWQKIIGDLRRDDSWDSAVFDATQRQKLPQIFVVPDELRREVHYWKDRRNDAAHFRDNEIGASHVESFWFFVRSNLPKFAPNGGVADLLARIVRHFDINHTPADQDVATVLESAPDVVAKDGAPAFLDAVAAALTHSFSVLGGITMLRTAELARVHEALLRRGSPHLLKATVDHLREDMTRLVEVVRLRPDYVAFWASEPTVIRRLWRETLWSIHGPCLPVLASLLRNGLIPPHEIAEATMHFARGVQGEVPQAIDVDVLEAAGFFTGVLVVAFEEQEINRFAWGNPNARLVAWLLGRVPLQESFVRVLCAVFASEPYPHGARDAIASLFAGNPARHAEFTATARALGLEPPATLLTSQGGQA